MATYTSTLPRENTFAVAEFLKQVRYEQRTSLFGKKTELPRKKTDNVTWRRRTQLALATTPIAEGVNPAAGTFTYQDVTLQIDQYGAFIGITDKIEDLHTDNVAQDILMQQGDQAGGTIDSVTFAAITAGTNVFFANGTAQGDVNTPITLDKQRAVVRLLQRNKAKEVKEMVGATVKISTVPLEKAYIAFIHPDLAADVRDLIGFDPVPNYANTGNIIPGELGKIENVRYVTSSDFAPLLNAGGLAGGTVVSDNGTDADVYQIVYFGQDAYGTIALGGSSDIEIMVKNPGVADTGDALGLNGTLGWKTWFAAAILDERWIARLEVAASEL